MKAWLARDKSRILHMFRSRPYREGEHWWVIGEIPYDVSPMLIDEIIGKIKVTWEGEPLQVEIEIKEVRNESIRI